MMALPQDASATPASDIESSRCPATGDDELADDLSIRRMSQPNDSGNADRRIGISTSTASRTLHISA